MQQWLDTCQWLLSFKLVTQITWRDWDLVGQEDLGPPLRDFLGQLVASAGSGMRTFYHAGETDWLRPDVDENHVDAVLLKTTRIGHGFAISKHPAVMEMAKAKGAVMQLWAFPVP